MKGLIRRPRLIVLTQFDDKSLILFMLKHGPMVCWLRGANSQELEDAIKAVMKDGHFTMTSR